MITESTRNDFCEFVYDSLSNEPDNYLANQIIDEFDNATKNCVNGRRQVITLIVILK